MAIVMSLVGAVASLLRGGRYVHDDAADAVAVADARAAASRMDAADAAVRRAR
jgi:predicted Co/Zn/Cd cation transporter (cation efflux family)